MAYTQEFESWQEMQETLQEAYEIQQNELNEFESGFGSNPGHIYRTPAVVIRIQLAPHRRNPIFSHPRNIVGATGVKTAPISGKTVVPVQMKEMETGEIVNGHVYAPEIGAQEFEAAFLGPDALRKAGSWLKNQLTKMPQLAQRIRGIKALSNGKSCDNCDRQFAQQLKGIKPPGGPWNLQFRKNADGKWGANVQGVGAKGQKFNLDLAGGKGKFKADLQGTKADGTRFGGDLNVNKGQWNAQGGYQGADGTQFGGDVNVNNGQWNAQGGYQGADGTQLGGDVNVNNGQWDAQAGYQGADGTDLNFDGQGGNGNFNAGASGSGQFGNFNAGAYRDGSGWGGAGVYQNRQGGYYGGGVNKNQNGLNAAGGWQNRNSQGRFIANIKKEMESSILGEILQEVGI
jgi:hypothetical protein